MIGAEGSTSLWLLVQHQDDDVAFQKQCLNLLKTAVDKNEASYTHYAYLLDRTRMNENLPQMYGTQWIGIQSEPTLYQTENIEQLDERRAQVGLIPLAEYKKLLIETYSSSS